MKYRYWLARMKKLSHAKKRMLLEVHGSCEKIYKASRRELSSDGLLARKQIDELLRDRSEYCPREEYERFLKSNIKFMLIDEESYPAQLRDIHDAPFALFYRGTMPSPDEKLIAVVGARRASAYGKSMTREIASQLCEAGYSIVSGMALGIDGDSHRGAISSGGKTYAILGCGVDVIYPKAHQSLYYQIIENGAVISDFPPGTEPKPTHFPSRNRLISGMSARTLVMEAKKKSGSLITADFALEQGRDVYALPGRITDPLSEGTNELIAQGAGPILSVQQLIRDFQDFEDYSSILPCVKNIPQLNLEKEEILVYSCFDFYSKGLEEVALETGMDIIALMSIVVRLCMRGVLKEVFKNRYIRLV